MYVCVTRRRRFGKLWDAAKGAPHLRSCCKKAVKKTREPRNLASRSAQITGCRWKPPRRPGWRPPTCPFAARRRKAQAARRQTTPPSLHRSWSLYTTEGRLSRTSSCRPAPAAERDHRGAARRPPPLARALVRQHARGGRARAHAARRDAAAARARRQPSLGDAGACAVASALRGARSLQWLGLDSAGVHDDGGCALAAALRGGSALRELGLQHNRLGDRAAADLAAALRDSCLEKLLLQRNSIGDRGAAALQAAADGVPVVVDLRFNLVTKPTFGGLAGRADGEGIDDRTRQRRRAAAEALAAAAAASPPQKSPSRHSSSPPSRGRAAAKHARPPSLAGRRDGRRRPGIGRLVLRRRARVRGWRRRARLHAAAAVTSPRRRRRRSRSSTIHSSTRRRWLFEELDFDGNGSIDFGEPKPGLRRLGVAPRELVVALAEAGGAEWLVLASAVSDCSR